jgi:beta-glucanase (GH16 family)
MKTRQLLLKLVVLSSLFVAAGPMGLGSAVRATAAALPVVDDFESGLPVGTDPNGISIGFVTFQDPSSSVAITTTTAPPVPVPGAPDPNTVLKLDLRVVSFAGFVHYFENASVNAWVSQDWSAYEGLSFWLHGNNSGTTMFVDVLDNRNPGSTRDDAERWSIDVLDNFSGWKEIRIPFASLHRKEIGNGAPNDGLGLTEVHGWALGTITTPAAQTYYVDNAMLYGTAPIRPLTVNLTATNYGVVEGQVATVTAKLSKPSSDGVTVQYQTSFGSAVAGRDYFPASGTLTFAPNVTQQSFTVATLDDTKYQAARSVQVELFNPTGGAALGIPSIARVEILDSESYDPLLLADFETHPYLWYVGPNATLTSREIPAGSPLALPGQGAYERVLEVAPMSGRAALEFGRSFAIGQDWSESSGLRFWYYGQNSGRDIRVRLVNDRTSDFPANPKLVWSDEFNTAAGAAPNAAVWGRDVGDGTINGIPGWGNSELQYYTAGTTNVATDGKGHLRITAREADGSLMCYYGPCEYTSARLLTKERFEVAYGRLEARIKVPRGSGLWPAFWMLGTDLDRAGWPTAGEIDVMEHVGREPNEVFGTLHGPGYSGGQSYGQTYDLGKPVADAFHVFAIEWQPDHIAWFIDGFQYFEASPADAELQGKQWVFNQPFFLLLNVAVGGNFGGPVGPETEFPQNLLVDYVRLYQVRPGPVDFDASFLDDFTGWREVTVPFSEFVNGDGAALDLTAIRGFGFFVPGGMRNPVRIDQVRLACSSDLTVTSAADSGPGSLRKALGSVCTGGRVHVAPALAGETITLRSGPLTLDRNVTIDAARAPGLTISGNSTDRVLIVNAGTSAMVRHATLANGYGWQLAGGVLNNGALTLDHVVVTGNTMATDAGEFWQGGGGIYSGGGSSLTLVDSTVSGNNARWSGGGLYSFFNTTTTIVRSTISGNVSSDVGGGIRSLGNLTVTNSTISGNRATGWHGGAIFQTDGNVTISSSTIANNIGPDWAPSTFFIGQFGGGFVPTLTLTDTIVTGNQWYACERFASGTAANVVSGGHNVVQDASCNPVANDVILGDAMIGPLAGNGGPTLTHALLPGSPAIDAAGDAACPATDQRGVARPQGAGCDVGAFERESP